MEDIFDLQDNIASSIVGCIEPKMRTAEVRRAAIKQTKSLQAYDQFLRALAAFNRLTRVSLETTLAECRQAVAVDPAYASAYGLAAWYYIWRDAQAWTTDPAGERAESIRHARLAVEFGADDPTALWMAGDVIAYSGAGNEQGARASSTARPPSTQTVRRHGTSRVGSTTTSQKARQQSRISSVRCGSVRLTRSATRSNAVLLSHISRIETTTKPSTGRTWPSPISQNSHHLYE